MASGVDLPRPSLGRLVVTISAMTIATSVMTTTDRHDVVSDGVREGNAETSERAAHVR
jgi:hypothetical protein